MNSSYYKNCIVPYCTSSTIKTPNKLFIYVPNNKKRVKWLKLAGRTDGHSLSPNSRMYFCEDHFDLPKDMANYMQYHLMGKVSVIRMNPECVPTKFDCQQRLQSSKAETFEECKKLALVKHIDWNSASEQLCAEYVLQVELVEDEECLQLPDVIFSKDSSNTASEQPSQHCTRNSKQKKKKRIK